MLVSLVIFEIIYRYQLIDFYAASYRHLNAEQPSQKPTILIFGDSFSADLTSYVSSIRSTVGTENVINSAIPGTTMRHAFYMSRQRLKTTSPQQVICQIYLGNDLVEEALPTNWEKLSFFRNVYFSASSVFKSLNYLNYRLAQLSNLLNSDFNEEQESKTEAAFSVEKYSGRTKMYTDAFPDYLNKTYYLNTPFKTAFEKQVDYLQSIRENLADSVEFHVLVIPHAVAVHERYREDYEKLGANRFLVSPSYPVIQRLKQELGIEAVWDPTEMLQKAENKGTACYFSNDEHLNPKGQQLLGDWITQKLAKP